MILRVSPPRMATSSWLTILMTCWAGLRLCDSSAPMHCLADPADEGPHDPEVDVGLEQGQADLAQDLVDVGVAQPAPAPQAGEDGVEAVGEGVEHAVGQGTRRRPLGRPGGRGPGASRRWSGAGSAGRPLRRRRTVVGRSRPGWSSIGPGSPGGTSGAGCGIGLPGGGTTGTGWSRSAVTAATGGVTPGSGGLEHIGRLEVALGARAQHADQDQVDAGDGHHPTVGRLGAPSAASGRIAAAEQPLAGLQPGKAGRGPDQGIVAELGSGWPGRPRPTPGRPWLRGSATSSCRRSAGRRRPE